MHCKMFGTRQQLHVFCIAASTLQTLYHRYSHAGGQVRVFSVSFLSAPPTWVSENIYVWRPHRKTKKTPVLLAFLHGFIILRSYLIRYGIKYHVHQAIIERSCHTYWLRKNSYISIISKTVQRFAPPIEIFDAEARNCGRLVEH